MDRQANRTIEDKVSAIEYRITRLKSHSAAVDVGAAIAEDAVTEEIRKLNIESKETADTSLNDTIITEAGKVFNRVQLKQLQAVLNWVPSYID